MQSLAPSKAEEGDKIIENVASVSCHASTAPAKTKHDESHGDKTTALGDNKPSSLPLKQNAILMQKAAPTITTKVIKKPEIPVCIEACDVSSLLDKFLEYEMNQSAGVNMVKNSSVALTPVSSPSHKNSCNLTEALNGNKKASLSSPMGLTPPVSPPSHHSISLPAKSTSRTPTFPVTTHDKYKKVLPLLGKTQIESKNQICKDTINEKNLMERKLSTCKASGNKSMNSICTTQQTTTTNQQDSNETPDKNRSNSKTKLTPLGNKSAQNQIRKSSSELCELEESRTNSPQSVQHKKTSKDDTCSSRYQNRKRRYSSDDEENDENDEKDYYDYKRKKYHGAKDECYWSTSEEESEDESRQYLSRKRSRGDRESCAERRQLSPHSASDSEDNCSFYGKSKRGASNNKCQRRKEMERKNDKCIKENPVYDIETERKRIFKMDRSLKETSCEKRKIVYIGNIENSMTKDDVWRRFREYGPIEKVTVHYRTDGDNYSFVTFVDSSSALEAIERGSKDPDLKHLDICFGGRRKFCGGSYVDFDSNTSYLEEKQMNGEISTSRSKEEMDFDALLKMCQRKSRT